MIRRGKKVRKKRKYCQILIWFLMFQWFLRPKEKQLKETDLK